MKKALHFLGPSVPLWLCLAPFLLHQLCVYLLH